MSSQPSSSRETVAPSPQPPAKPPEALAKELLGGKVIFFTMDTLFNRDYAIECALRKCMHLNKELRSKSMGELKTAYRGAIDAAYRQHIHTQVRGPALHDNNNPQAPTDKVGLMFQQLKLELPSASDRTVLSTEFAEEFNLNRFEALGASHLLEQLKRLRYSIVIVDHSIDWEVVEDLNFWPDVDAMILTEDLVVRKPDRRVFQKALDECQVSAKPALIVGCSVKEDIVGILDAGAEPILYMPGHNYMTMDVQGTRVVVVRTMAELSSEIHLRPENSQLMPVQHNQPPPRPQQPAHPPLAYAPQNQANPSAQNAAPSSARQQLPSIRPHPLMQDDVTSSVNPAYRSSPSPSTQSYGPRAPTPAREVPTPSGQGSGRANSDSNSPVHSSGSSTSRVWLPFMTVYPPTEDYGISIRSHNEDQPRSRPDGYGHGTSRDRSTDQGGYPPPPRPRPPYRPPTPPSHTSYQGLARPWQGGRGYETSMGMYNTQGGYLPPPPELRDLTQTILDLARDLRRPDSSSKDVDEQTEDMAGRQ